MRPLDLDRILGGLAYRPGEHFGILSGPFGLLLLAFLAIYPLARSRRARTGALLAFSLYFYYKAAGAFVVLLVVSTLLDFEIGRKLAAARQPAARRAWLWAGVAANLAVLACFRYTRAWAAWMPAWSAAWLAAATPIGVSFYTFQKIGYLADVRAGKTPVIERRSEFLLFVAFFPRVLAGPIVKAGDFVSQIASASAPSARDVGEAVFLILSGLFKKAVVADYIGVNFVDRVFAAPTLYSGVENLLAVYGYAFQIYGDFSGYTDIALGLGRLVGVRLPPNFATPYRSASVTDFWRRWHITLSNWLREYVFLPVAFALSRRVDADRLAGVKADYWIAGAAAMVTWVACGLWHGAAWGFVVWGALHGMAVTAEKVTRWPKRMARGRGRPVIATVLTFHFVCAAWVFFRADTLGGAVAVFRQIAEAPSIWLLPQIVAGYPLTMALIALGFVTLATPSAARDRARDIVARLPLPAQSAALAAMVWVVLQVRSADIQPFVYFRF